MRIALVTTPAALESSAATSRVALLIHLRAGADVTPFVEPGREGECAGDERPRSLAQLAPREYDQILYLLENERPCGFMLPAIRALGGTVLLGEWGLGQAARGAYASLDRGGWRGYRRALAEGGLAQARAWAGGRGEPALNRSAVRFGDAFLVPAEPLRALILAERNERTPIALLPAFPGAPASDPAWGAASRAVLEALEGFPHARSARRSLVALAFRARAAARQARLGIPREGAGA